MTVELESGPHGSRTIDLDRLLAPIPGGDNPAGESLRYEGTYDLIREARREDDPTLPQGVWKTELKKADWPEVAALCEAALEEKTKDLQIGGWLVEAWLRLHGLRGAATGLTLVKRLCEEFWEDLYPELEDGDFTGRLAPVEWLNDKVTLELKRVAVTDGDGDTACSWLDWERALFSAEARGAKTDEGKEPAEGAEASRSRILTRVSLTSTAFYRGLSDDLEATLAATGGLERLLDERCGPAAPGLGQFREVLTEMGQFVGRILEERQEVEMTEETTIAGPEPVAAEAGETGAKTRPAAGAAPAITSRGEAYRYLSLAADYLLKTEPHSPAPYLVRRAIAWGRMSLAELLKELLRNNADLPTVYTLLGIGPREGEKP